MIKYALSAAVAALALGAPGAVEAQTAVPQAMPGTMPDTTVNTTTTVVGQPQPGSPDYYNYNATQMPAPYAPPAIPYAQPAPAPISPRTLWIPGTYNWDPSRQTYVWTQGQYVEAPSETAQWVPGHWTETPTSWIWVDGRWQ
jgi:hypothetical protein